MPCRARADERRTDHPSAADRYERRSDSISSAGTYTRKARKPGSAASPTRSTQNASWSARPSVMVYRTFRLRIIMRRKAKSGCTVATARPPHRSWRLAGADRAVRTSLYAGGSAARPVAPCVVVANLVGVATPLAKSFLAIGGAICGDDFFQARPHAGEPARRPPPQRTASVAARRVYPMSAPRAAIACLGAGRMWAAASRWPSHAGRRHHYDRRQAALTRGFRQARRSPGRSQKTLASFLARFDCLGPMTLRRGIARISVAARG